MHPPSTPPITYRKYPPSSCTRKQKDEREGGDQQPGDAGGRYLGNHRLREDLESRTDPLMRPDAHSGCEVRHSKRVEHYNEYLS